ncbi:hypothetical protein [Maridesulfovibrio sp.]|uniref:hypothetical protein n=1 Tax=Maridesulfovibrio sp. TaxID=2795000 RepID=UPI0039EE3A2A
MRNLIFETITKAAMAAGLPAGADGKPPIYEAPVEIKDALLPNPRIEILLTKAPVKPVNTKLAKFATPEKEDTHRTVRTALDQVTQPVRLSIVTKDENWLKDFAHSLHTGLPRSLADRHNNVVKVSVEAVDSTGGGSKLVKVAIKEKLTKVFHLRFTGLVTRDSEVAWIKEADINVDYKQEDKDA